MFHGPASTMKHIQGQRMSLCFVSGCMVPRWSRQVPVLPRGPSVPDVFLCVQQYSLGKNILGKDYAQSNGMPFRWKCTATWAHPYSFAFLDEYVHSLTSRSLALFIELRAEVDHTNIMS